MGHEIIPSGDYAIHELQDTLMVAHLGSCVGVTLRDRVHGVGGLLHILLPDPIGMMAAASQPMFYASSGLPLFLDEMRLAGAEFETMEAVVAGGALIGPVSQLDVNLDVGGRTADVVFDILHQHNIKILHSETGGATGCKLTFDCSSLDSEISFFERGGIGSSSKSASLHLTPSDVQQAIDSVSPIPQNVLKIIRMIQGGDYEMRDVARNVRKDQVISAKILNLCNTAFFHRRSTISSIDTALVMLGEKTFLQMILSASVESFFNDSKEGYSLVKGGLYYHSLGTAIVAERIASLAGSVDSGSAYTAGLLHDIGKVVLDQFVAPRSVLLYNAVKDLDNDLLTFEKNQLAIDHTEVGRRLGEAWALPDNLIDVIAHHHKPSEATFAKHLTCVVYLADLLMSRYQVGLELERIDTSELKHCMKCLGLGDNQLGSIVSNIPWKDFEGLLNYDYDAEA